MQSIISHRFEGPRGSIYHTLIGIRQWQGRTSSRTETFTNLSRWCPGESTDTWKLGLSHVQDVGTDFQRRMRSHLHLSTSKEGIDLFSLPCTFPISWQLQYLSQLSHSTNNFASFTRIGRSHLADLNFFSRSFWSIVDEDRTEAALLAAINITDRATENPCVVIEARSILNFW